MNQVLPIAMRKFAINLVSHWAILFVAFQITGEDLTWPFLLLCGTFTALVTTAIDMIDHWPKKKLSE